MIACTVAVNAVMLLRSVKVATTDSIDMLSKLESNESASSRLIAIRKVKRTIISLRVANSN